MLRQQDQAPMIFRIELPDGTSQDFTAPTPDTITVSQWRSLVVPPIQLDPDNDLAELEANQEIAHRYAGIPKDILRRLPLSDLRRMMEAFADVAEAATEARKEGKGIPDTITHLGVTYRIPKDPGMDLIYGQYIDLTNRLSKHKYEDEGIAAVLGVCLIAESDRTLKGLLCRFSAWIRVKVFKLAPLEAKYDSSTLDERIKAFETLPAMQAIPIAAFFFVGWPDLERLWSRSISRSLKSRLLHVKQTMDELNADTVH